MIPNRIKYQQKEYVLAAGNLDKLRKRLSVSVVSYLNDFAESANHDKCYVELKDCMKKLESNDVMVLADLACDMAWDFETFMQFCPKLTKEQKFLIEDLGWST